MASTGQGILGNNMFAYCNNNPIVYSDFSGQFPWLVVGVIVGLGLLGGILGYFADEKMTDVMTDSNEEDLFVGMPNPPISNNAPHNDCAVKDTTKDELETTDRLTNAAIGAALGVSAGGLIVSGIGVVSSVIVGSATTFIGFLGATGLQTFAYGALAYDVIAMVVAPFIGAEMEPIEYE